MRNGYSEVQIDFTGDITCDRPMLAAARQGDGGYDFDRSFKALSEMLSSADCVIGNLETVFAGEERGYNPGKLSYNSPDALCKTLADIIGSKLILTTANNHCLDCGKGGASRTLRLLQECGIANTGMHEHKMEKAYHIEEINGIRFGIVSFTACMNQRENGIRHSKSEMEMVNSLIDVNYFDWKYPVKVFGKFILKMTKVKGDRKSNSTLIKPRKDDYDIPNRDKPMINRAIKIMNVAKTECDFLILCVHTGGQFNDIPGKYTEELICQLEPYADLIVCNHPHVIQRIEMKNNKLIAYSLGSLNMSPSADYVSLENLPQYSLALSVTVGKDKGTGAVKIKENAVRVLKTIEDENHYLYIYDTEQLLKHSQGQERTKLEKDLQILHNRIGLK